MEFTSTSSPDDVHAAFLRLFHDNEGRFRALTRTLVASNHDAQDIFQEAALTMFKKFPERDHNQDFVEWGFRVISFKVREWRQKKRRLKWQFSEETLRLIADDAEVVGQSWHARNIALQGCLERLCRQDREMLAQRYAEEGEIEEIAFATGRTVQAVYRKLSRLRQSLAECIKRALSQMNEDS